MPETKSKKPSPPCCGSLLKFNLSKLNSLNNVVFSIKSSLGVDGVIGLPFTSTPKVPPVNTFQPRSF